MAQSLTHTFGGGRRLLGQGAVAVTLRISGALGMVVMSAIFARKLGLEDSGRLFLGVTFLTVAAVVIRMGLDGALLRLAAALRAQEKVDDARALCVSAVGIVAALGLLGWALCWIGAKWVSTHWFGDSEVGIVLRHLAPLALILPLSWVFAEAHRSAGRIATHQIVSMAGVPILVSASLAIRDSDLSLVAAADTYVLVSAAVLLGAVLFWVWIEGVIPRVRPPRRVVKKLLAISPSFLGIAFVGILSQQGGAIVVGVFSDEAAVAIYHVGGRIAAVVSLLLIAANTVVTPEFARLKGLDDPVGLETVACRAAAIVTVGSLPAIAFVWVRSEWLMGIYGPDFVQGAWVLKVLAVGQLGSAMAGSVGLLLLMVGKERGAFIISVTSMAITMICWVALIPEFGALGAAIGNTIGLISGNIMGSILVRRTLGFWIRPVWVGGRARRHGR